MMDYMHRDDELAEVDLTEDEIDAMMAAAEPVEVVGPPSSPQTIRFEVLSYDSHRYIWRLSSPAGRILATSETYPTKRAAWKRLERSGGRWRPLTSWIRRRADAADPLPCCNASVATSRL